MPRGDDIYDVTESDSPHAPGRSSPLPAGERDKFTCPYCDQKIDLNSPVCPMCGSSLRNAPRPAQGIAKAASSGRSSPASIEPSRAAAKPVETRTGRGKLISAIVVAVIAIGISIWGFRFSNAPSGNKTGVVGSATATLPQDQAVERQIEEESGTEARAWLENDYHEVQGLSQKQALYKVDELYSLGAVRVVAFGGRISRTLAIELPADKIKRKQILDFANKWNLDKGFQKESDAGQKWLVLGTRM